MATAKKNAVRTKRLEKKVVVGHRNLKPLPGIPGNVLLQRFATVAEAQKFLDKLSETEEGVDKGKYFIEAPESMIPNGRRTSAKK